MQIVKTGTKVTTVIGSVEAIITGVCIRENSISYEIGYFCGGDYKTVWISRFEFDINTSVKTQAGFKSYETKEDETQYTLIN